MRLWNVSNPKFTFQLVLGEVSSDVLDGVYPASFERILY
jgi:hypothetical protein